MPNSPKTAARKAAMNAERRRLYFLRHVDPTGAIMGARRRAEQAVHRRRNNAARIIQARVRGMLTRQHLANPHWGRTYANVVAGRPGLGARSVMRLFTRPNNMRAHGAAIRACIRHGPEHYVSGRLQPRWRKTAPLCHELLYGPGSAFARNLPRGYFTRTRSPPRNRSPRRSPPRNPRNNNNNLYH